MGDGPAHLSRAGSSLFRGHRLFSLSSSWLGHDGAPLWLTGGQHPALRLETSGLSAPSRRGRERLHLPITSCWESNTHASTGQQRGRPIKSEVHKGREIISLSLVLGQSRGGAQPDGAASSLPSPRGGAASP